VGYAWVAFGLVRRCEQDVVATEEPAADGGNALLADCLSGTRTRERLDLQFNFLLGGKPASSLAALRPAFLIHPVVAISLWLAQWLTAGTMIHAKDYSILMVR
jgi:hypothetical protein